jgi:hypothetical protein
MTRGLRIKFQFIDFVFEKKLFSLFETPTRSCRRFVFRDWRISNVYTNVVIIFMYSEPQNLQ